MCRPVTEWYVSLHMVTAFLRGDTKQVQTPARGTLFSPPSGSLQSSFNSSVRALNSLKSVQCEISNVQKSSRKITYRKMNEALSVHLRLCPLPPLTNGCHSVLPVDELPLKTPNYIIFLLQFSRYTVTKGIPKSLSCVPETVPHLPKHKENN